MAWAFCLTFPQNPRRPVHSLLTSLMPFAASRIPMIKSSSPVQCNRPFQVSPTARAITAT